MSLNIIQEYLVSLGWDVDQQSFNEANKAMGQLGKQVEKFAKALSQNEGFVMFSKNLSQALDQAFTKIATFASSAEGVVLGAIGNISAGLLALAALFTALLAKFMSDTAKADLQVQLLARRLFTTVENARSLKATMDAMGLHSMEDLKDVAFNPELRQQFFALRNLSAGLELNEATKQGFKNIRALGFEFQKLSLVMNYFWQMLGGQLGKVLEGPLRDIQHFMMGFNRFVVTNLPAVTHDIASAVGIAYKLLEIFIKLNALLFKIPAIGPLVKAFFKVVGEALDKFNRLLDGVNNALDWLGGADSPEQRQDTPGTTNYYLRRIYDFLTEIGNFFLGIFKPIRDFVLKAIDRFAKDHPIIAQAAQKAAELFTGTPAQASVSPLQGGVQAPGATTGKGGKHLFWGTVDRSSSAIDSFVKNLDPRLQEFFRITAGVAKQGHVSHGGGLAFDVGLAGKSDNSILGLVKAALATPGLKMANLELSTAHYRRILASLKSQGIEDSRVTNYKSKFSHGDHLHVGLQPVQNITIHVHGGDKKTAQAIHDVLQQQALKTTRFTQGSFA